MTRSSKPDYTVGRGRPPTSTRFTKGQSGNPSGRPRGTQNFSAVLRRALTTKVVVTENGRQRKITKLEAITTQLVNQAAKANMPAMRLLTGLFEFHQEHARPVTADELRGSDHKVMGELIERLRAFSTEAGHDA